MRDDQALALGCAAAAGLCAWGGGLEVAGERASARLGSLAVRGRTATLQYVGCFANGGASRQGGHVKDQSLAACSARAAAAPGAPPAFGMEWPQDSATAGHAYCLPLASVSTASRLADAACAAERDAAGRRLGSSALLAVYARAAPAVLADGSARVAIARCLFAGGAAGLGGAAVHARGGARLALANTRLEANRAVGKLSGGGALLLHGASATLARCELVGNSADNDGGAVLVSGGRLDAADCAFRANVAKQWGGALMARGGAAVKLTRASLVGNRAGGAGGAVCVYGSITLALADIVLEDNTEIYAVKGGGGIFASGGAALTLRNATLRRNAPQGLRCEQGQHVVLSSTLPGTAAVTGERSWKC